MRPYLIIVILLGGIIQNIFAQNVRIRGIVRDANRQEPLEFVHIVLQRPDSVFVTGVTSDAEGRFVINNVAPGDYLLAVSGLGYKNRYLPLKTPDKDITLETILLEDESVSLENVTVSASNLSSRIDRKIIYPSERQVNASTNGVDLLQQLMLPKLIVNPLFNEVSLPGGGELQYRINGVKVEVQDILALQPAEIIRLEFHDNPGLRYGNAEVVLDYIVRRPETGGSVGVNLENSPVIAWGNNRLNAKVNHKKSEFGVNYGVSHRDFYKMWRDNEETFTFADGSSSIRKEAGEPGHGEMYWQWLNGTYSYQDEQEMFSATARYYGNNTPHFDYKGSLYNPDNPANVVYMIDRSASKAHRPALDLYYQHNLKNGQTLVLNAVGTYNYTDNTRLYRESREGIVQTDINSFATGKKYSFIGEGIYEKAWGANRLSAGLRHTQAFSDNNYKNGVTYTTEMSQSETFAYTELKGKAEKLDYTAGAGVARSYLEQEGDGKGYQYYTFNPRFVLQYALSGRSSIRLKADISNASPTLSNLSDVEQSIDSLQIQRGNPDLTPFLRYRTELTCEIQKGLFYGNLWGAYEYHPKAIMDEKRLVNDRIVQTWDNQQDWQRAASRLMLRIGPVKDILQLSVTGGVNHYVSNGNTYHHTYTNWFMNGDISATYRHFTLGAGLATNWNWFYGETMDGGENLHFATIGYKYKTLSVALGMFMPFADNYKQDTENRSQYASYHRSNYINESSRMLFVRLTWNFSFGRTFNAGEKRLNNTDEDSGVMNAGK